MIVNIQEQLTREWKAVQQVNYSTVFSEKKQLEENLANCMKQYEERFKRLNEHMESGNEGYLKAQEELKNLKLSQEREQKSRDEFLTQLLEKSNSMKNKIIKICSDKQKAKSQKLPVKDVEQTAAAML